MHAAKPNAHSQGFDRDALERVVQPVLLAHGAELVELELKPDRGSWVLRIFVEKAGASDHRLSTKDAAISLELCADVSRDLSPALDVVDLIPHTYHLEVSSPGIERPLRAERDFVRFAGEKVKLRLRDIQHGEARIIIGTLEGATDGVVRVKEGTRIHEARLESIESARLVFEFGTSSTQNKKKHRG